jgi:AcrR family transcriptional regulator
MRWIADRPGIRAPSIYKRLPDKQALEAAIISLGFELQADAVERAVATSDDPLRAVAHAYRAFTKAHPHLCRLMTDAAWERGIDAFSH